MKKPGIFSQFLLAMTLASSALGMHNLVFPWLIVGELKADPDTVGFAMMLAMLPPSFLLLWGGAVSDGRPLGGLLLRLYTLYTLPLGLLLVCRYWLGWSYPILLLYGMCFGVLASFMQPARETLLGVLAQPPLQKAVAKGMIAQSFGMGAGSLMGGVLIKYSLTLVVLIQMLFFLTAGWLLFRCSPEKVSDKGRSRTTLADVASGVKLVIQSPLLRNLMLMIAITGFLGFGFYFVMLPVMTREVYQAEASFLAGLQALFLLGSVFVSLVVVRWFGNFRRPGRVLVCATILRGVLLLLISLRLPAWMVFPAIFLWGFISSISSIAGRTMVHEYGPDEFRSRLISIYQLSLFGTGPFGALIGGLLMDALGVMTTTAVLGGSTIFLGLSYVVMKNTLWRISNKGAKGN